MANFNTHIAVGTVTAGLGATVALASGVAPATELLTLVGAGVIGSIGPDVDRDNGDPLRGMFGALGIGAGFAVVMHLPWLPWWELVAIWLVVFGAVSVGVCHIFTHYTAHRGIWHSLLAALFFGAVAVVTLSAVFGKAPATAWLGGAFMTGGYVVHLILDEFCSIDFAKWRIKQSFGTALKLWDYKSPLNSGIMAAAVLALLFAAPSPRPLVQAVHAADAHQYLATK